MFSLLSLVCLFATGLCVQIAFKDCGSSATVESFDMMPCSSDPCHVHTTETYTGTITIVPHATSTTATNKAIGVFVTTDSSREEKFGNFSEDACSQGLSCPLVPGTRQTYRPSVTVPILGLTPTRWVAKWMLKDDNNHDIVCINFPIYIDN